MQEDKRTCRREEKRRRKRKLVSETRTIFAGEKEEDGKF